MDNDIRDDRQDREDRQDDIALLELASMIDEDQPIDWDSEDEARSRMGQYRIGFYYGNKTVELVRILHRKEIYRYFP